MFPIKYYVGYYKDIDLFEFVWNNLLLQKDNGHLWYLPCLFFVFLCMYLIIKSYQCFASTMLKNDVRIFEGIGVFCLSGISILAPILWRGATANVLTNMIWFYIGYLASKYKENINQMCYSKRIIILLFTVIFSFGENILFHYLSTFLILLSLYLLMTDKSNKTLKILSDNSFGVYLLHSPLIYITYSRFVNANPLIVIFINFVIFGGLGLILTMIIKKSKLKIIIGS